MALKKRKITEFTAKTLIEAFSIALEWTAKASPGGYFWFRGVKDTTLDLEPGAYWRSAYDEFPALVDLVQEGRAFAEIGELDDWNTYYFAQHNGIPTRLLDWTESFSAAMFFALDNWDESTTPCIWVMRPEGINELSIKWEGMITPEQNKELDLWLPKTIIDGPKTQLSRDGKAVYNSEFPLAIYPRKGNARMISQQGTFTVHGTARLKLNQWIVDTASSHDKIICKINLKKIKKTKLWSISRRSA